jgi:hypothetical protein
MIEHSEEFPEPPPFTFRQVLIPGLIAFVVSSIVMTLAQLIRDEFRPLVMVFWVGVVTLGAAGVNALAQSVVMSNRDFARQQPTRRLRLTCAGVMTGVVILVFFISGNVRDLTDLGLEVWMVSIMAPIGYSFASVLIAAEREAR